MISREKILLLISQWPAAVPLALPEIYIDELWKVIEGKYAHENSSRLIFYKWKRYFVDKYLIFNQRRNSLSGFETIWFISAPNHLSQITPLLNKKKSHSLIVTTKAYLLDEAKRINQNVWFVSNRIGSGEKDLVPDRDWWDKMNFLNETEKSLLSKFLLQHAGECRSVHSQLKLIIKAAGAKRIFIGNALTFEGRILNQLARQEGIFTFSIQHGLIDHEELHKHIEVDRYYIFGNYFKEIMISDGMSESKLRISGAPYLDAFETNVNERIVPEIIQLGWKLNEPYILIALSGPGDRTSRVHYYQIIDLLFSIPEKLPDLNFVFKLHRKEKMEDYLKLMESGRRNIFVIPPERGNGSITIFDWLSGAQMVITGTSTVAIESALFNVPVISLDLIGEYRGIRLAQTEAMFSASDTSSLLLILKDMALYQAQYANKQQALLEQFYYKLDGGSADRILIDLDNDLN